MRFDSGLRPIVDHGDGCHQNLVLPLLDSPFRSKEIILIGGAPCSSYLSYISFCFCCLSTSLSNQFFPLCDHIPMGVPLHPPWNHRMDLPGHTEKPHSGLGGTWSKSISLMSTKPSWKPMYLSRKGVVGVIHSTSQRRLADGLLKGVPAHGWSITPNYMDIKVGIKLFKYVNIFYLCAILVIEMSGLSLKQCRWDVSKFCWQ